MEVGVPLPMDYYKNKLIKVTDCFPEFSGQAVPRNDI